MDNVFNSFFISFFSLLTTVATKLLTSQISSIDFTFAEFVKWLIFKTVNPSSINYHLHTNNWIFLLQRLIEGFSFKIERRIKIGKNPNSNKNKLKRSYTRIQDNVNETIFAICKKNNRKVSIAYIYICVSINIPFNAF